MLLNSDTKVTSGFIEEMLEVLYASPKHGVVSPRSNNATIVTIPLSSAKHRGVGQRKSYSIYKKIKNKLPKYYISPVAHGFCMLIRRDLIGKFGLFDAVFGKGYGEEVDFCQRIKKKGYLSIIANHAYVFHLEGRSFSIKAKTKFLEEHYPILWERYPDYRQSVRDYMSDTIHKENVLQEAEGIYLSTGLKYKIKTEVKKHKRLHKIAVKVKNILT